MRQLFYYKVQQKFITKYESFIRKSDSYYRIWTLLKTAIAQSLKTKENYLAAKIQKSLVHFVKDLIRNCIFKTGFMKNR